MLAEMKILGTLFRLVCALLVLLAITLYLGGSLQASLTEYVASFSAENLRELAHLDSVFTMVAGGLLLLALCGSIKLGWNIVYSLATIAIFAEFALLTPHLQHILPTALRGLGWEEILTGIIPNYPVAAVMVPVLCILGVFCSNAPIRIALTSLISWVLCVALAELLHMGVQYWAAMPEPFMPQALGYVQAYPWVLAALPAAFFLQYCLYMAMFEAFIPRKKKARAEETKDSDCEKPSPVAEGDKTPAAIPAAAATVAVAAKATVVKRPVIHKKSPISPTADEKKKEEAPKAEAPAEEKMEEAPKADAPAEEKKEEDPRADAPAEEKKEDEELPSTPIPSVPMPPMPNAAS